jgi:hypothetical protein
LNINVPNVYRGYSTIILEKGIIDINLINNHINYNGSYGRITAIELIANGNDAISNVNICNNTIVMDSSGTNIYGIYASSNNAESLNKITIAGNDISVNCAGDAEAIYLYKISDSVVNDNVIVINAGGLSDFLERHYHIKATAKEIKSIGNIHFYSYKLD